MIASVRPLRARREPRRELPSRRSRVEQLVWPPRPRRQQTKHFGLRQRWISRCGRYRIDRCLEITKRFIAVVFAVDGDRVISDHSTLSAAKRACQSHLRKRGG
jgi:hypothetical protein